MKHDICLAECVTDTRVLFSYLCLGIRILFLFRFLFDPYLWFLLMYSPQMWGADVERICAIERR